MISYVYIIVQNRITSYNVCYTKLLRPVSALEGAGAVIGNIYPATYFINISRGVFSKALEFSDLRHDFAALAAAVVVIIV